MISGMEQEVRVMKCRTCVPVNFTVIANLLKTGATVSVRCIRGLPSDAQLVDVITDLATETMRFVFEVEGLDVPEQIFPQFYGSYPTPLPRHTNSASNINAGSTE